MINLSEENVTKEISTNEANNMNENDHMNNHICTYPSLAEEISVNKFLYPRLKQSTFEDILAL